jgi:hypothetical protein
VTVLTTAQSRLWADRTRVCYVTDSEFISESATGSPTQSDGGTPVRRRSHVPEPVTVTAGDSVWPLPGDS